MIRNLIVLGFGLLLFCFCSKTPVQRADDLLKKGDKRGAYILLQRAMQEAKGAPSPMLKTKFLSVTLRMAKDRLTDDESLNSVKLFYDDFKRNVDADTPPEILADFALFLCEWSDSVKQKFEDIDGAVALLDEAQKNNPQDASISAKAKAITDDVGNRALAQAKEKYAVGRKKPDAEAMTLVEAEYYALLANKYLPQNKEAQGLIAELRRMNLGTYSAYNRALESGKTDPQIDRFSVYLAVTKRSSANGLTLEGSIYSLSPLGTIELSALQFTLADENGRIHQAASSSKFQKTMIDAKMESKVTLVFPTMQGAAQKLVFNDGKRTSEKYFP